MDGLSILNEPVPTNIVFVKPTVAGVADVDLIGALEKRGVLVLPLYDNVIRLVVHNDIAEADIIRTIAAFREALAEVSDQ
jgi:threonine aldolase